MKYLLILFTLSINFVFAQTFEKAIEDQNWEQAITFEKDAKKFTAEELFDLGYAFYRLDKYDKSKSYMNEAIEKGANKDYHYYYRGALMNALNKYDDALSDFKLAASMNPISQANVAEIGRTFALLNQMDSAMVYLYRARKMTFESESAYTLPALILASNKEFEKANIEIDSSFFYLGNADDDTYKELVKNKLFNLNDLKQSDEEILVYILSEIKKKPNLYSIYTYAIQCYNNLDRTEDAMNLVKELRIKFKEEALPAEMMEKKRVLIDIETIDGRDIYYYAMLYEATETLDLTYLAFVYKEKSEELDYRIMTEKTIQLSEKSPKHLLCGRGADGTHYTFVEGWKEDDIPYADFKILVEKVVKKEITPGASSNFGGVTSEKEKKKKSKKAKD